VSTASADTPSIWASGRSCSRCRQTGTSIVCTWSGVTAEEAFSQAQALAAASRPVELDRRRLPGRAGEVDDVAEDVVGDLDAAGGVLCGADLIGAHHGFDAGQLSR